MENDMTYYRTFIATCILAAAAAAPGFAQQEGSDPPLDGGPLIEGRAEVETGVPSGASALFDTDRGVILADTDDDSFPDLTEAMEGTNPLDAESYPGSDAAEAADEADFPAGSCRSGFRQAGSRLCVSTNVNAAATFANALVFCRDRQSTVADYGDLRYLYVRSTLDAAYNPNGRWIGNFVDDDTALCGNRAITSDNDPDIANFEGECSRFDSRGFWCAHDLN
jgi:hypothetical protein